MSWGTQLRKWLGGENRPPPTPLGDINNKVEHDHFSNSAFLNLIFWSSLLLVPCIFIRRWRGWEQRTGATYVVLSALPSEVSWGCRRIKRTSVLAALDLALCLLTKTHTHTCGHPERNKYSADTLCTLFISASYTDTYFFILHAPTQPLFTLACCAFEYVCVPGRLHANTHTRRLEVASLIPLADTLSLSLLYKTPSVRMRACVRVLVLLAALALCPGIKSHG